ncbi:hypothetical protein L0152_06320 [bacterium]|nr:hypothetical protein [bacterium]
MRSLFLAIAFVMAIFLAQSSSTQAQPVEIDFSVGPTGDTGLPTYTDPGTGLIVYGLYFDGADWALTHLFRRNETNDHGFGVCSENEQPCPGPPGGGDINELDNDGDSELIVLQLPAGYEWVSVQVSSMDDAGGTPERGILYADDDGVLNAPGGNVGDTILETFEGGGGNPVEPTFNIPAANANSPYLVFEPFDFTDEGSTNNDYLVYKATIQLAEGGQGCTPGYWKQPHHLDSWVTYLPTDLYDDVFGVTSTFEAETLLEVLKQGGGKEIALGRHAVAALLNSVNPDVSYEFTAAEVIQIVQDAYNGITTFKQAKKLLEAENETVCPLN